MKEYLDLTISATVMIVVSPVLIGLALAGALVSGKPVIYGVSRESVSSDSRVSSNQENSAAQQAA